MLVAHTTLLEIPCPGSICKNTAKDFTAAFSLAVEVLHDLHKFCNEGESLDWLTRKSATCNYTPDRWQSKTLLPSTNVGKKSLETEFLIAICRLPGDKWQKKTQFLAIFDRRLSIFVKSVLDCHPSNVNKQQMTF